jgi:capsular polysaccharide transport system permease protein
MSGSGTKATPQDSYIVLNYIKSEAILVDLGGRAYLEKYYSGNPIDMFSRLKRGASIEDLLKYWLLRVVASVETQSGILTVKVEAFRPQDAAAIAKDVVRLSENLTNSITLRSRRDAIERGEHEVTLAAEKLAAARDELTLFRNQNVLIDPGASAQSLGETIGKLTGDKIAIESQLATFQGSLNADSPTQRIQRKSLAAIEQQIAELKNKLTGVTGDKTVSTQIAAFERLKLKQMFAERMYAIAQNSYEKARQELEKQQIYLSVIVPPITPEDAATPRIFAGSMLVFASLFIFWAIVALVVASIHDQMV